MIVLHLSDTHFGRPHRPAAAAAALRLARREEPAAVVVSGDLTQRAKAAEFRAARAFLASFAPVPVVVVPGNHDVPLYRFWERLAAPWAKYRACAGAGPAPGGGRLDGVLDVDAPDGSPGARFVALNSAAPRTAIVNGRLTRAQLRFADRAFAETPGDACRVLVVHHNLLPAMPGGPPAMRGARRVLDRLSRWRADLVLCGHVHRSWLADGGGEPGIPLVHAGTASSSRGRPPEEGRNSLNLVRIRASRIEVTPYLFSGDDGRFLPVRPRRWERSSR